MLENRLHEYVLYESKEKQFFEKKTIEHKNCSINPMTLSELGSSLTNGDLKPENIQLSDFGYFTNAALVRLSENEIAVVDNPCINQYEGKIENLDSVAKKIYPCKVKDRYDYNVNDIIGQELRSGVGGIDIITDCLTHCQNLTFAYDGRINIPYLFARREKFERGGYYDNYVDDWGRDHKSYTPKQISYGPWKLCVKFTDIEPSGCYMTSNPNDKFKHKWIYKIPNNLKDNDILREYLLMK
jgi:hypothetical protein